MSDPTDGYTSIAELDEAVATGGISFDRYWTVRTALEDLLTEQAEEHAYDPAPVVPSISPQPRELPGGVVDPIAHRGRAPGPGFVAPAPHVPRVQEPPRSPRAMVPPPPPPGRQPTGPVTLPVTGPTADAAPTRADDRRTRRRKRRPR